jgi:hypothetical protein
MSTPVKPDNEESGELSPAELDILWKDAREFMLISDAQSIEQALSGDDQSAAHAHLTWLLFGLRDGQPINEQTRAYAVKALQRFGKGEVSLGVAFGVERSHRGHAPNRTGAVSAINGLIAFLHEKRGYGLGESQVGPSAFDIASQLLKHRWGFDRSPYTLRDHWGKRKKGENR